MTLTALVLAGLVAALAATALHRWAPPPSADVDRGTEDAFAKGLQRRELPPRLAPIRWTTGQAVFSFAHLPRGEADLEVAVAGHRGPVVVAADGVVVGTIAPGATRASFHLPATPRDLRRIQLEVPVFTAGDGRQLGARLQRVSLRPLSPGLPSPGLLLLFVVPALLAVAAGRWLGLGASSLAFAAALTLVQAALLWPSGLIHSPYAALLASLLGAGVLAAFLFARLIEARRPSAGRWALVAMTAAWLVQWVLATSPVMVVSDVVFHANTLARVAGGDYFPTSVTQHAPPFRFPYGVSFYAILSPLARAGGDGVALVRIGAAMAGVLASGALFVLLLGGYGAAVAGLAVLLLQFLPATFDVAYSYGNFSNGFGQSATIAFFAWWAGTAPGGSAVGALLLATAALAHFSSLVVVVALCVALVVARRRILDPRRRIALLVGLALAAAYYAHHVGLVASQLPRLLEGGRGGEGGGVLSAVRIQVMAALTGWGPAALALAWFGRPRWKEAGLDRDLAAWWLGVGLLALPAIVSPLEVRYLYALTPALAAAAGRGAVTLHGRGGVARALAIFLVAGQLLTGGLNLAAALLTRYRP